MEPIDKSKATKRELDEFRKTEERVSRETKEFLRKLDADAKKLKK